ncbi:methanogenesis marker 16 metalloprotein [uncultured Methanosphaera sp.]|uniref:methanogenesis marker 16 metalloprotein n=1 Tax=uncultured Methanosphaera sp. TaxID=262501 RepID=UPI0025FDAF13|nr:methanogenesis marker 16 metalloprotein [uncultured Methanosphaera sp.]
MAKTIEDIQKKLDSGDAVVLTAEELKTKLRDGEEVTVDDVDVVTCGTSGVMSGTAALFHMQITEPGAFTKAKEVYINGIPAYPGPCPNELLGSVDVILYGTNHSQTIEDYGGGFLIKDLINGKAVEVKVIDLEGNEFTKEVTLDEMNTARMIGTRMAFKNYNSFTNPQTKAQKSIFNVSPMEGPYNSYSFSGCGDINPLQNDPEQKVITPGTKILLNGAEGVIIDNGTRSNPEKPNLLLTANIKDMNSYYVGGFKTGLGPEVFDSVAIPIPVLNEEILENLKVLNKDIPLPLADIHGRHLPIDTVDYTMWDGADLRPTVDPDSCFNCIPCLPEIYCPVHAYKKDKTIDPDLCYGCGYCATVCPRGVPSINMGSVTFKVDGKEKTIPVTCRQSDKKRGMDISEELKKDILEGSFKL